LEWKINGFTIPNFSEDSLSLFFTSGSEIEIIETNEFGCTRLHERKINLLDQPASFNIISNQSLICSSDTTVMYQVDPKDIEANTTYSWEYKSSVIKNTISDGNNRDSLFVTFNDPTVSFAEAELIAEATNEYGCTTLINDFARKIDTVFQSPKKISKIISPNILCDTKSGEFEAIGGDPNYDFIWSTKTPTTTNLINAADKANKVNVEFDLNNTTDTLANIFVYQNNNGCIGDLDSLEFFIHTNPKDAIITGADSVCSFTKDQLIAVKPHEKTVFDWTTNGFEEKGKDTISYQFADTAVTFTITQTNQ
ncbi:MAG: hypothetical protein GY827_12795, partial [Cytophagales bacterium]|nr:hypothetical protein [Cytophagales bacterium]